MRPTEFTGVPRIWEKLKAGLEAKFAAEAPEKRAAIRGAIEAGLAKVRLEQAGQPVPEALAAGVARAEEMVFAPLRRALGLDQSKSFFVGAAPTPRDVLEFFHAIGIPIVRGVGDVGALLRRRPRCRETAPRSAPSGAPCPASRSSSPRTARCWCAGRWSCAATATCPSAPPRPSTTAAGCRTGDIGKLDDEGFLSIVDRKKEIIINSGGKNMSPANIEARIKTSSPLIGQAIVVGDARPYNVALLVLDPDGAATFARAHGLDAAPAQLLGAEPLRAEIARAIAAANDHLSRVEQIKRWEILADEWLPGGDELTPTMKLKRKPILAKYASVIEALYGSAP